MTNETGSILHACDHQDGSAPHVCMCELDADHTADNYDAWLIGDAGMELRHGE